MSWGQGVTGVEKGVAKGGERTFVRVGFWNVENLFDTINDMGVNDGQYTPAGKKKWGRVKYDEKVDMLGQVVGGMGVDLLGLCEVENRGVVEELALKSGKRYNVVHYDSCDPRGIDQAILYDSAVFRLLESGLISTATVKRKREILYAKFIVKDHKKGASQVNVYGSQKVAAKEAGKVVKGAKIVQNVVKKGEGGDTVLFYVLHLPSKLGGEKAVVDRGAIVKQLDSIVFSRREKVVVMGDMNDDPISVASTVNTAVELNQKGMGTYVYRGVASMLDQILVSRGVALGELQLLNNSAISRFGRSKRASDHRPIKIELGF